MNHLIWGRKLPNYQDDETESATHHGGPTHLSPEFPFISPIGLSCSLLIRKCNLLSSWRHQGTNRVTVIISGPPPHQVWQPPFYTEDWCFFGWHTQLVTDLEGCACHVPDGHALSHPSSTRTSLLHPCQYVPSSLFASLMQVCMSSHLSLKFIQASRLDMSGSRWGQWSHRSHFHYLSS